MKSLFRLTLIALFVFIVSGETFAFAYKVTDETTASFITGVRWDEGKIAVTIGSTIPVSGNVYAITYGDAGTGGTLGTEFCYLFHPLPSKPFYIGPLAGPGLQSNGGQGDAINYLTGAAGVVAAYGGKWGGWGAAKYKFKLEENQFLNNWLLGCGLFIKIE
ncbi:MAG: hypothetical protein AB1690_10710 [Candidatus Zixiibacteriota bacterium]